MSFDLSGSEEDIIQRRLVKALDCHYDRIDDDRVKEEYRVKTDGGHYIIDVAIPGSHIAIECKDSRMNSIAGGVGQASRYEVDNWSSYLCIPASSRNKEVVDMCLQAGIGLMEVTDKQIHDGHVVNVVLNNDVAISTTKTGYLRSERPLDVPAVLNALGVDTMDDVMELDDKLSKIKPQPYGDDRRWKNVKLDRSILPEYSE